MTQKSRFLVLIYKNDGQVEVVTHGIYKHERSAIVALEDLYYEHIEIVHSKLLEVTECSLGHFTAYVSSSDGITVHFQIKEVDYYTEKVADVE